MENLKVILKLNVSLDNGKKLLMPCDKLKDHFKENDTVFIHKTMSGGANKWPCQNCHLAFKTEQDLKDHREESHPEFFNNSLLGSYFANNSKILAGMPDYKCTFSFCQAVFKQKHALTNHEKQHKNACEVCLQSFKSKIMLTKHKTSAHKEIKEVVTKKAESTYLCEIEK